MEASTQTLPEDTASPKLQSNAASAALYVTRDRKPGNKSPLDKDGKLSSASAATSLKRAAPRDLPAYPIVGITNPESSAGAAASLAAANHKDFEHWKPEASAPAGKAAMLAKDYKAPGPWKPEPSGYANTAAMLVKDNKAPPAWKPSMSSAGSKAALLASQGQSSNTPLRKHDPTRKSDVDYDLTQNRASRALEGAVGAVSNRRRADSTPVSNPSHTYPDAANSASNALSAATFAHKPPPKKANHYQNDLPSLSLEAAARIHKAATTNMKREMYTSNPPVAPEVEERNKQASLRAAAMTMAKSMYDTQQRLLESPERRSDSHSAATYMHNRQSIAEEGADRNINSPNQYIHLQETAQKLAAERLAKLSDKDAEYREYYGARAPPRSRMSLRGRRRSSSADQALETDQQRSQRIRAEMSGLNKQVEVVDAQKRQKDRASLLAAARRNVTKSIHGMDERVFAETGKASPAMKAEWEAKARARAEAESNARLANHGKVAIGGGRYLDQSEIDAIAAARVQPTLDEISKEAEEHRARDEALRQKIEEQKQIAELKKADDRERDSKTDEEWRRYKEEEKQEKRIKKEELAKRDTEAAQRQRGNRKSRGLGLGGLAAAVGLGGEREKSKPATAGQQAQPLPSSEGSTSLDFTEPVEYPAVESSVTETKEKTLTKAAPKDKPEDTSKAKDRPIPFYPAPTTETFISGGQSQDSPSQEGNKKTSWFRRFSRHGNKPSNPEEPAKKTAEPTEARGVTATEHGPGLPADASKKVPTSGGGKFDGASPAGTEPQAEANGAQAKEEAIIAEPVTGLPMDTSKSNPGFGTDGIPHIQAPKEDENEGGKDDALAADHNPAVSALEHSNGSEVQARELISTPTMPSFAAQTPGPIPFTDITQSGTSHLPNSSEHDVAMAGRSTALASHPPPRSRSTSISSISSDEPAVVLGELGARGRAPGPSKRITDSVDESEVKARGSEGEGFREDRDDFNTKEVLGKPRGGFAHEKDMESSPARGTRFREEL